MSTVPIVIDTASSAPAPFEQVRRQVVALIGSGDLLVGTRLPTVRALAAQLSIAANTVARAYRELESDGVIETRGRHGSFVRAAADTAQNRAQSLTVDHLATLRALGLADDEIVALLVRAVGTVSDL